MFMNQFMKVAINEAKKAIKYGDVPVGAVIVKDGKIIAQAHNKKEYKHNAIYHAEILAIEKACEKLGDYRLNDCVMYVTFEPCIMCVGAILSARIQQVYFGAYDYRFGASSMLTDNNFNHITQYQGGIDKEECSQLLSNFFEDLRKTKKSNSN